MSSQQPQRRDKEAATAAVTESMTAIADTSSIAPNSTTTAGSSEVWFREEERWELTWPIWHMLPREERRTLAHQHGYKTIGEFEEYMTLQRAVGDSSDLVSYELLSTKKKATAETADTNQSEQKLPAIVVEEDDDEEDGNSVNDDLDEEEIENRDKLRTTTTEELIRCVGAGGKLLMLSDDMLHRVFEWLPVDTYAVLALVSPHWQSFTRTEAVYKRLCERLYLNQSKRRALHVSRFGHSYRTMLEQRPRVRAGGGVYVLKYARVKKIQRDMWTEIPAGAVLEMVYYRYLYFFEDGRVLYALTPTPPHEMFPRLRRVCLTTGHTDPAAVWGTYHVQKTCVTVHAKQEWHSVQLFLTIDLENRWHGRYGCLSFDQHMTSRSGDFSDAWQSDRIIYEVPEEPFRFVKDKRL